MKSNQREASESFHERNPGSGGAPEPQRPSSELPSPVDDFAFPTLEYALTLRSRG